MLKKDRNSHVYCQNYKFDGNDFSSELDLSIVNENYQNLLINIIKATVNTENLDDLLQKIVNSVTNVLKLDNCFILHLNIEEKKVDIYVNGDFSPEKEKKVELCTILVEKFENTLLDGQPLVFLKPEEIKLAAIENGWKQNWKPLIIYPIKFQQNYLGVIALRDSLEKDYKYNELILVESIANQCAIAINQSNIKQKLDSLPKQQETETTNKRKLEYLSHMNHELRAPLSAILGLARMLNEQIYGTLNQKQNQYIQAIIASGEHLLELINDFLDLSKIDAEKEELYLEKILVEEICQSSLLIVEEKAERKQISLCLDIEEDINFCVVDQMRFKQILVNLLSNAVKFTETGSVTLKVARSNPGLAFNVIDTGIGISLENQAKLFQPFYQIPNHLNRQQKGTGLGLVLSRKLAQLHGGDLTVTSTEGKGSCFTVHLPVINLEE